MFKLTDNNILKPETDCKIIAQSTLIGGNLKCPNADVSLAHSVKHGLDDDVRMRQWRMC